MKLLAAILNLSHPVTSCFLGEESCEKLRWTNHSNKMAHRADLQTWLGHQQNMKSCDWNVNSSVVLCSRDSGYECKERKHVYIAVCCWKLIYSMDIFKVIQHAYLNSLCCAEKFYMKYLLVNDKWSAPIYRYIALFCPNGTQTYTAYHSPSQHAHTNGRAVTQPNRGQTEVQCLAQERLRHITRSSSTSWTQPLVSLSISEMFYKFIYQDSRSTSNRKKKQTPEG